jgi:hypothetical protein
MEKISSLMLLVLLLSVENKPARAYQAANNPIAEEGLIRLLENEVPRVALIRAIESRGVAFQLTSLFEREVRDAGKYLGKNGLDALLTTIRANFRPPAIKPYRLTYRILQGHAVSLLLDGRIGRWDKELDGRYFIVQNEVLKTLADLVTRFSDEFYGDKFFRRDGTPRTTRALAKEYEGKPVFAGSAGTPSWYDEFSIKRQVGELSEGDTPEISHLVNSLNDPNEQWRFNAFKEKPFLESEKPLDILSFRRFSKRSDLDLFGSTSLREFYSYITKDYMPPDFGFLELSLEPDEGCDHHAQPFQDLEWTASFFGPLLSMNVAIVENISNQPVSVGRVILSESHSDRLQSRQEAKVALGSQPTEKQDLFRPGILKPGESLVIPIELLLKAEKRDLERFFNLSRTRVAPTYYTKLLERTRATGGLQFPGNSDGATPIVNAATLEKILKRDEVDFFTTNEYVYGPSVRIESLEINRFAYLVRQFDPSKLLITSGVDPGPIGSCPYVYTYSDQQKAWLSEGVILYGLNSKLKESTDEIVLRRFDGKVLIRELDPEDSFIDSIYVRALGVDGKEHILFPQNAKLLTNDGDYVHLKQGDHIMLDFQVPRGFALRKWFLVASGYYVPYNNADGGRRRPRKQVNAPSFP